MAAFGMLLRSSRHGGRATFHLVRDLAAGALGQDPHGYRAGFLRMLEQARALARK